MARAKTRRWSIGGDSAGANLALAAVLALQDMDDDRLPAAGLLFYGADFETRSYTSNADGPGLSRAKMMRYWDWYAPRASRGNPLVAALAALPSLYLNAAELDPLLSDTENLAVRLRGLDHDVTFDLVPRVHANGGRSAGGATRLSPGRRGFSKNRRLRRAAN